jgi:acyl-CoA reductase-like NAD-dependent aldehyde dehydrogenase
MNDGGFMLNYSHADWKARADALSAQAPFGGMKQSGYGRDLSLHSLDKYTALKTI